MIIFSPVWFGVIVATAAVAVRQRATVISQRVASATVVERPALIQEALNKNKHDETVVLYYFGLGSNMLRSKLENRSVNGSKIEILSMEPAVVLNHRLSFNLRGFLPLEPGMGSLEPVVDSSSQPLHAYGQPECHGALITLTVENYEKVMRSEGVGHVNGSNPGGYEEVVVTAIPYDRRKQPVQAITLRARPHVRLQQDPCPSERYMTLLKQGAAELQLQPDYQHFLSTDPVQQNPVWLKRIAVNNLIFTSTLSFRLKWRGWSRIQSWCLFQAYVPSTAPLVRRMVSDVLMAVLLLPGAVFGCLYRLFLTATKRELSPMIQRFVGLIEGTTTATNTTTVTTTTPTTTVTTSEAR